MLPILYEYDETSFTTNGIYRLTDCISCTVTEERNGIYECDFEYPVSGAYYNEITCGRIIAVTHDDTGEIQPFDIVSCSRPISGVVSFHAVHISYRQTEMVVSGTNINSLSSAFTLLGNATPSNPFSYETDKTSTGYLASADGIPRTVRQILGGVDGSILDAYGGEYEWDCWTVRLWSARGEEKDFVIRYGLNLSDYNEEIDYSETFSSVVPFWKKEENGSTIVVRGDRVDSGFELYSGRNACVPLDLTDKFETRPSTSSLESTASTYMTNNEVNIPSQNISVDFVRLEESEEFSTYSELLQCNLCDSVRIVFPMYDMVGTFKIVKTVYNVLKGRYDSMELGTLSTSLSDALGVAGNENLADEMATVSYIFPKNWGTGAYSGDCQIIVVNDKVICLDSHRPALETETLAMFSDNGISHIDYFILTHYHLDHYGNIGAFIDNGLIDNTTEFYLPPDVDIIADATSTATGKTAVATWLSDAGITGQYPTEGGTITIGNFTLTFYNCDVDILNASGWTNYNLYSVVCLTEHGDCKALWTADAYSQALYRLYEKGWVTDHIGLLKMEHHGINAGSVDTTRLFNDIIHPEYAVQTSGLGDAQINNYTRGQTLSQLEDFKSHIYSVHENTNYIVFADDGKAFHVVQGREASNVGNQIIAVNYYVDINTTNTIQNGTQDYPFRELSQALGAIIPYSHNRYTVYLADGTYNTSHSTASKNKPLLFGCSLTITATNGEDGDVTISNGLYLADGYAEIHYCTFDYDDTDGDSQVITTYRSHLYMTHCALSGTSGSSAVNGIAGYEMSQIYMDTVTFTGFTNKCVILTNSSVCNCYGCTFSSDATYSIHATTSSIVLARTCTDNTSSGKYVSAITSYDFSNV